MNLLLLAIAFRAWSGSAHLVFLRIMAAIAVFSLEMQLVTWLEVGTIRSLRLVNVTAAVVGVMWHAWHRARERAAESAAAAAPGAQPHSPARTEFVGAAPVPAIAILGLIVCVLAVVLPVRGADPYHLHRVDQITRTGTLAYDPGVLDIKINAMAGVYELLLADLRIPGMSTALVRLHGLFGLAAYLLTIAVVAPWLGVRRRWLLIALLVVPVVFHQLVLVKNDLFGALPAFVALAWVVARGREMPAGEIALAAALAGFAVGIKISSAPIVVVVLAFVLFDHRGDWRTITAAIGGGLGGALGGGLLFTLVENQLVYGGAVRPYLSLGNRNEHVGDALTGVGRFALSLFDLGRVTPRLWPGRGGWGSTFGLPLVWALVVLAMRWRETAARRALSAGLACFVAFAMSYPDADIAHRMIIAPGLLLIVAAVGCVDGEDRVALWLRRALVPVILVSAMQITRSAMLYLSQR